MFAFFLSPLGAPSSLATATVAFPGDDYQRIRRTRPALALCLSGGLHAAALTLFLLATARSGSENVRLLEMKTFIVPFTPVQVDRLPSSGGPPRRSGPGGIIDPAPPTEGNGEVDLPVALPGDEGAAPVRSTERSETGGGAPGTQTLPPTEVDSDQPVAFDEPPVPIVAPEPVYPPIAREAGIEGRVVVHALVTRDGRVAQVDVTGANVILGEAASQAVRLWKFRPAKRKGHVVAAWIVVPVNFRLQ